MKVLEVGCGTWSRIRDHCLRVGASYEGLDVLPEYYGVPCIATRLENLAALSFRDEEFDLVIGNQTMEHWAEHGCTPQWGLYQCFRVTKPGGSVFLNVPIHFHGTKDFVHGNFDRLQALFGMFSGDIAIESWGNPTAPLAAYFPHPDFVPLKDKPAYVVDIRARRDRQLPTGIRNTLGVQGKLAQMLHYSFSYNVYRVRQRVRTASRS
jgi:SAM-dependent methyltransferase